MNNFSDSYLKPWRQYAVFTGRSNRAEYWVFTLVNFVVVVVLRLLSGSGMAAVHPHGAPTLSMITGPHPGFFWLLIVFDLAALIPGLAVSVRRFHDLDRSGWWLLLGLIPLAGTLAILVWFCFPGTPGPNRFGPNPLDSNDDTTEIPNVPII